MNISCELWEHIECPECGYYFVHPKSVSVIQDREEVEVLREEVNIKRNTGGVEGARGAVIDIGFICENDHKFTVRLRFHKGLTYLHAIRWEGGRSTQPKGCLWRD